MMLSFKDFIQESSSWPSGHWFNHDSGQLHDVSHDGGPGDHMGFLWAADGNHHKLGIEDHHAHALRDMYEKGEPSEESHQAQMHILKKNTRLIHHPNEINATTADGKRSSLRKAQTAVSALVDHHPGRFGPHTKVSWEGHEDWHQSGPEPINDFLTRNK